LATTTGYEVGGSGSGGSTSTAEESSKKGYWSLGRLKQSYQDYLGNKREEIDETQKARAYVHGSHWTSEQMAQLNARKQPATFENIVGRKIRGVVGTLERLKQDPKAYARTPKHEQGADLATAALRYALESQNWQAKDPLCSEQAAIEGIGGVEFNLIEGDQGDPEIEIDYIDGDYFFYDPRSFKHDFSDAVYLGTSKWMDLNAAIDWMPSKEDEIRASVDQGSELTKDSDRENRWARVENETDQVRIVECWYRHRGEWCYSIFTGSHILAEGKSPFKDEKKKSTHKYEMFSAYIDQDGDRYGLPRDLMPLNQAIDMCKSKALYASHTRRIMAEQGAFDDVEVARRESARADGVIVYNKGFEMQFDDAAQRAVIEAMFKFYEVDRTALESFGPNIAVTGEGLEKSSGRAIHLLQQAGLADLGPFIQAYRGWKIRVYRKMWNAIQQHWKAERWIRVTDDDQLSQFIQVNGLEVDPMTGQPMLVNVLGSLDVDIILDEGPDAITTQSDAYDTLLALSGKGAEVPPNILLELAPIPSAVKQKLLQQLNPPPSPEQQQRAQIETQMGMETVKEKAASAKLKEAQALQVMAEMQAEQNGPNPDIAKIEMMQVEAANKLRFKEMEHEQTVRHKEQEHALQMQSNAQMEMFKREQMKSDMQMKQYERASDMKAKQQERSEDMKERKQESRQNQESFKKVQTGQENTMKVLTDAVKALSKPKKVIRGKDGRVSGVE
jgi:hypothetical protein